MLRINVSTNSEQAKDYFTESLNRGDYYRDSQEMPGRWGGKLAETLGLSGEVNQKDFFRLCENRHPQTGGKLTPRTSEKRRVGYDLNFHCPKSVSLLFALGGDERLLQVFRDAVTETMRDLETEMRTRVRVGGKDTDRHTGNMVWAEFVHTTARPVGGVPDPHLHAHCFTFNATHDPEENRFKAGEFGQIKGKAPLYEAMFLSRLAAGLCDLGYKIVPKGKFWEIDGISQSLVDKFSRRTSEINKLAKDLGIENEPERKAGLGKSTRERKQKGDSFEDLRQEWKEAAGKEGDEEIKGAKNRRKSLTEKEKEDGARHSVAYAILHTFEAKSAVPERELLEVALRRGAGRTTKEHVEKTLEAQILMRRTFKEETWVTTLEVHKEESDMIAFATETQGKCKRIVDGVHELRDKNLNNGQRAAVRHVLNSYDQVMLVRGGAGTGKTKLMTEAISEIQRQGLNVIVLAPQSDTARQTLPKEGFKNAETVAGFLVNATLQDKNKGGVIWIDEAGMLGTRTMNQLFSVAQEKKCRVVCSGDYKQHKSQERGDAIRILIEEAGMQFAETTAVVRQKGEYKEACELLSKGDYAAGWGKLDSLGFIKEYEKKEGIAKAHEDLATEYLQAIKSRKSVGVSSPTIDEGVLVTAAIRSKLQEAGYIANAQKKFTRLTAKHLSTAQKANPAEYKRGMVIEFHQNSRGRKAGERAMVMRVVNNTVIIRGPVGPATPLVLRMADARKFSVYERERLSVGVGDMIRITRNGKSAGDLLGFLPDRRNPLTSGWQLASEIADGLKPKHKRGKPLSSKPLTSVRQLAGEIVDGLKPQHKRKRISPIRSNPRRLNNGAVYRVIGVIPISGDLILNNGYVMSRRHGHFTHAYCSTSPASQSKTFDRYLVAQTSMSFGKASNAEQGYVSATRGRESCSIFTDDKATLLQLVKNSSERTSATKMIEKGTRVMGERARRHDEHMNRGKEGDSQKESGRDHER